MIAGLTTALLQRFPPDSSQAAGTFSQHISQLYQYQHQSQSPSNCRPASDSFPSIAAWLLTARLQPLPSVRQLTTNCRTASGSFPFRLPQRHYLYDAHLQWQYLPNWKSNRLGRGRDSLPSNVQVPRTTAHTPRIFIWILNVWMLSPPFPAQSPQFSARCPTHAPPATPILCWYQLNPYSRYRSSALF